MNANRPKHSHGTKTPREILQQASLQPTVQRLSLLRYLLEDADHPTAEQVRDWAYKHLGQISQGTVYNTLNALVSAGIIRQYKLGHSDCVIYDCNTQDHFHFLDEATGKLFDIQTHEVQFQGRLSDNFQVKSVDVLFRGSKKT
jgi:Fur family iron response transcriptional regulator